ncbi:MAG: hypothetical protein HZA46_00460 [Planctomycetales bacterium]|nr:hypothetical protein [Planctomycetales bacterium]
MLSNRCLGLTLSVILSSASFAFAQERANSSPPRSVRLAQAKAADVKAADPKAAKAAAQPAITIVLNSAGEFLGDIEFLFKLAGEPPARFRTLADTLEAFLDGVDRTKPLGVQVFVDGTDFKYVAFFPVKSTDLKKFLENLAGLGIKSKKGADGSYALTGDFEGFLRAIGDQVVIGSTKGDILLVKSALAPIVGKDGDIVVLLDNSGQPAEDRRKGMTTLRANTEKTLKKKEGESDLTFAVRKAATLQQLDELERFFVDSAKILAAWTTSAKDKNATFELDLTAIPGTSLEKSVQLLGTTDNLFGGIETKGTVASLTVNFPIDDLRKKHLAEQVKLTKSLIEFDTNAAANRTAEQKAADKVVVAAISDAVDANIAAGSFNAFLRIHPNAGGKFATVGGIHVADVGKVMAVLKAIEAREGADKVKFDADSEGDVKIHAFEIADVKKEAPEFLGADGKLYLGTGKDTLWIATGDNAVEQLKTAIKSAKTEPANQDKSTMIDLQMRLGPWLELLDGRRAKDDAAAPASAKTPEEKKKAKSREMRKLAVSTLKDCQDTLSFRLERDGQTVKLRAQFDECLLKLAGKISGKVVKEKLE